MRKTNKPLYPLFLFPLFLVPFFLNSKASADITQLTMPDQYLEGKNSFLEYCARCHGVNADGRGRVAPIYIKLKQPRPSNFTIGLYTIRPAEYLERIISEGGEPNGLSHSMPPFKHELSSKQISNLVYFIQETSKHKIVLKK